MKKFGVIGHNIGYSLSPRIHDIIFDYYGLVGYGYEIIDLDAVQLQSANLRAFNGFNVTVPYKKTIIAFLDENRSGVADSVNTVKNQDGRLVGYNTDAEGFLKDISAYTLLAQKSALVLGAGSAARTVCSVLKEADCQFKISARRQYTADSLAALFDIDNTLDGYKPELVIGCSGQPVTLSEISDITDARNVKLFYDLSYRYDADTAFSENGIRYVPGKGMLVHQALGAAKILYDLIISESGYPDIFKKIYSSI